MSGRQIQGKEADLRGWQAVSPSSFARARAAPGNTGDSARGRKRPRGGLALGCPDPRLGAPAGARGEAAVARDSCPLPLRLPSMLSPLAAAVGTRGISFGPSPGPGPAPAVEDWKVKACGGGSAGKPSPGRLLSAGSSESRL